MDKRQTLLAAGIALLCAVLWIADGDNAGGVSEIGMMGLIALAGVLVVRALRKRQG